MHQPGRLEFETKSGAISVGLLFSTTLNDLPIVVIDLEECNQFSSFIALIILNAFGTIKDEPIDLSIGIVLRKNCNGFTIDTEILHFTSGYGTASR